MCEGDCSFARHVCSHFCVWCSWLHPPVLWRVSSVVDFLEFQSEGWGNLFLKVTQYPRKKTIWTYGRLLLQVFEQLNDAWVDKDDARAQREARLPQWWDTVLLLSSKGAVELFLGCFGFVIVLWYCQLCVRRVGTLTLGGFNVLPEAFYSRKLADLGERIESTDDVWTYRSWTRQMALMVKFLRAL